MAEAVPDPSLTPDLIRVSGRQRRNALSLPYATPSGP